MQVASLVLLAVLQHGVADEAAKTKALFKELDKTTIPPTIITQLETIAKKLHNYYKYRPITTFKQWVVAVPLVIDMGTDGKGPIKLDKGSVIKKNQIFSNVKKNNYKLRPDICDNSCLNTLNTLPTRIKRYLGETNQIHTEIQMLYRHNHNLMTDVRNKDKVILVYSRYIPCSQNQNSKSGVFLECAGEMANFVVNKNPQKNKFIVFYETVHKKKETVKPVSQLYMQLSGIVSFKYNPKTTKIKKDSNLLDQNSYSYLRKKPTFLNFGRPILNDNYKTTVTQLFVDCLARNQFIKVTGTQPPNSKEIIFVATKFRLYREFSMDEDSLANIYAKAKNYKDNKFQKTVVEGCYQYAIKMAADRPKKTAIIVSKKATNYLNFRGTSIASHDVRKPRFQGDELQFCNKFMKKLNEYFAIYNRITCQKKWK